MVLAAMSDILGTTWWSILCLVAGFGAGLMLKNKIMNLLGR